MTAPWKFEYQVTVLNVVDGDTLDVDTILEDSDTTTDYGFRIRERVRRTKLFEQRMRLYGVNTPERGKPGYKEAGDFLRSLVMPIDPPAGFVVMAHTVKPHEKYGRWLASLDTDLVVATVSTSLVPDVAQAIIAAGFGVFYDGGTKSAPIT